MARQDETDPCAVPATPEIPTEALQAAVKEFAAHPDPDSGLLIGAGDPDAPDPGAGIADPQKRWGVRGEAAGVGGYTGQLRHLPWDDEEVTEEGTEERAEQEEEVVAEADEEPAAGGVFAQPQPRGFGDEWDSAEDNPSLRKTGAPPLTPSTFCCMQGCKHYMVMILAAEMSDPSRRWKDLRRMCDKFRDGEGQIDLSDLGLYACSHFMPQLHRPDSWLRWCIVKKRLWQAERRLRGSSEKVRKLKKALRDLLG